jgi:molybdate transport system ATP-binding protein
VELDVHVEKQFTDFKCSFQFLLNNEKCGVFGPSGSGKSTLMNMLAGLITPDTGKISLNGTVLFNSEKRINLPPDKRKIGVVFQHALLFPHMSVKQNLLYGAKRRQIKSTEIVIDQLVAVLQLNSLMGRNVTQLSGGEKQRVALGRTILATPDLILLDEPLTGLDGQLKFQIIPYLQKVFSEFAIPLLFISHSLQEMRMMTDNVLVIGKGEICDQLSTEDLARSTLGTGGRGYTNLLDLEAPKDLEDLFSYQWGKVTLMLVKTDNTTGGQFSLGARDILLFKKHPEAASARNMLACTVRKTYHTDWLVGVELDCMGSTLIAEIVPQSVEELNIKPGSNVIAVIKASAFQRLY